MAIYLLEIFFILFMSIGLHPECSPKGKKYFLFLSFLLLSVVSGLRGYTVGADTEVYVRWYSLAGDSSVTNNRFEVGFMLYMKILHVISADPTFLLFVSSIISVGSYCLFAYRFSKRPTISVLLYILMGSYFSQMNTMRQSLATSLIMLAFMRILTQRDTIRKTRYNFFISVLLIVLATSFHTVAIMAFVPWFILFRHHGNIEAASKLKKWTAVVRIFLLAIVAFLAYTLLVLIVTKVLPGYAKYFSGEWSDANYNASLFNTVIVVIFLIVGAISLPCKYLSYLQRFAIIMVGLSIIFSVLSMRMEIWNRLIGIFDVYTYLIWVPEFLNGIRLVDNRRVIEASIFLSGMAYMLIVLVFRPEWTMVVPYVIR